MDNSTGEFDVPDVVHRRESGDATCSTPDEEAPSECNIAYLDNSILQILRNNKNGASYAEVDFCLYYQYGIVYGDGHTITDSIDRLIRDGHDISRDPGMTIHLNDRRRCTATKEEKQTTQVNTESSMSLIPADK